jgi:hypothetical protein
MTYSFAIPSRLVAMLREVLATVPSVGLSKEELCGGVCMEDSW